MTATELTAIRELLRSSPKPESLTAASLRDRLARLCALLPAPQELSSQPVDLNGVPGIQVTAQKSDPSRCIYYLHGGGYVIGSAKTHEVLAHDLSEATAMRVCSLDYRLAPEHPFPAGLEDAIAGYRWLLANGHAPKRIAIAGDSAGGGLAVATLVALRERGLPLPACAVCFSPWVDLEATGASMDRRADVDPMVQREGVLWYADLYLAGASPRHPLASPLHADLSGLPPVLIQVGDAETLLDDSLRLAERLQAAGCSVDLRVWDRMIHVWQLFAPILSEGRDAIAEAAAFINERIR